MKPRQLLVSHLLVFLCYKFIYSTVFHLDFSITAEKKTSKFNVKDNCNLATQTNQNISQYLVLSNIGPYFLVTHEFHDSLKTSTKLASDI